MVEPVVDSGKLRVVELAQGFAGPALGRLLAGFGHDVIKVEPRDGDWLRHVPVTGEPGSSIGLSFKVLNEAKRSVFGHPADTLADPSTGPTAGPSTDPSTGPSVGAGLAALLDTADIVVADFLPAQAAAYGLAPEQVRARWPHLLWVSVTGFGLTGTHCDLEGDSLLAEAFGGLAHLIGRTDREPLQLGGEQTAHAAALAGLLGVTLALLRRRETGQGDLIDVALADVAAYVDWKSGVLYSTEGILNRRPDGRGLWRIFPTADGHIGVVFTPQQWDKLLELVDDERLRDPALRDQKVRAARMDEWMAVIGEWAAGTTTNEGYLAAQRLGLPFGRSVTVADLDTDIQLRARGFVADEVPGVLAPWQIAGLPWSTGKAPELGADHDEVHAEQRPTTGSRFVSPAAGDLGHVALPLAGVTVLDLGTATAGPGVGRLLADYGALVIKVEAPNRLDSFRVWARPDGLPPTSDFAVSPLFDGNNAGKLAVGLDLKDPTDRAQLLRLAAKADVLIENYRVGVPARLGIDLPDLLEANPDLICLSLASQGQVGPEARYASYGSTLDLLSGLASVTGYRGGPPTWSSYEVNYPDQAAVLAGAALVVTCLQAGVRGVRIDLSQRELVASTLADRLVEYRRTGQIARPEGNRRGHAVPHGAFLTGQDDRWVAFSCRTDAQRQALATLVTGLPTDPAADLWRQSWDTVDETLAAWVAARPVDQVLTVMHEAGVPCVPFLDSALRDLEPRFRDRRVFVDGPNGHLTKGFPILIRSWQPEIARRGPMPAEHDGQLLT